MSPTENVQVSISVRTTTFCLLLTLVAISPFPIGAVGSWAWGAIACTVGLLLLLHGLSAFFAREPPDRGLIRIWPFLVPFGLTALWIALQASPLTPESLHHPLWAQASASLGTALTASVSLDPFATYSGLIRLLAYAGIFWLAMDLCRSGARARQACLAVTLIVLAYAIYGLAAEFSGTKSILWFDANRHRVVATFVNYNSFATYAGLGLVVATGLLLEELGDLSESQGWRRRLHRLIAQASTRRVVLVLAWIIIATALLLSTSRGGFLSTALGLAALLLIYSRKPALRTGSAIGLAVPVVAAGLVLYLFSGEVTDARLGQLTVGTESRTHIFQLTLEAISDRPLLGTGYGTFADIFRAYRSEELAREVLKAHNSYLEAALGLGVPVACLFVISLALAFARCFTGVGARRKDFIYPCIGVGATVLVSVHALVDFSLQIPSVAVTYAFILGVATAQSWPTHER